MASVDAFIAASRFGLGAAPGDLESLSADPRGWLRAQLHSRYISHTAFTGLPSGIEALQSAKEILKAARAMKEATSRAPESEKMARNDRKELRQHYLNDIYARTQAAVRSPAPFFERLVHFWGNHFTVSVQKAQLLPMAGAFEREAIRPHILGSFEELLLASCRHPAMLAYLDNARSIGPLSRAGTRRGKGLNENLAREILELHTLGVNGGYRQEDVIALAKMLTGWTIDIFGDGAGKAFQRDAGGGFAFVPQMHEPGAKYFLGRDYPESGYDEAESALRDIAIHPSTAQFIATKLARHFISDTPPTEAVAQLARVFRDTNGNLTAVYETLIRLDACWQPVLVKVKTPNELVISLLRGTQVELNRIFTAGAFKALAQMPFSAPSPQGWSDEARDWMGAEALLQRIDLGRKMARALPAGTSARQLLDSTIGPVASASTHLAVATAGSPAEALTLLFASPEFQRR